MPLGPGTADITPTMLAPPRTPARVATVRQQFDQRANRFGQHDAVAREIERRMIDRLDVVRLQPQHVLDVGCGAGHSAALYARRYPAARWTGADLSERMLGPRPSGWANALGLRRRAHGRAAKVCADAARLPLSDDSVDLVHSNLMVHWHPQPHTVFPEWRRVLRVGGLLMFSCFGPDTLRELRAACTAALAEVRPMPFVDMHDFGDMLVAAGFEAPVMDAEVLALTYASPQAALAEVRALGGNPRDDRRQALPSTRQTRVLLAALEATRGSDGRIALTFEVAYGHAWKPAARGTAAIGLESVRAELARRRRAG